MSDKPGKADLAGVEARVRALVDRGELDLAATEAIRKYSQAVLRYLRSLLRDEEDAADANIEWAERIWQGLPEFRWASSLRTWAYAIAWNVAQSALKDAWRRRRTRLPTSAASHLAEEIRTKSPAVLELKDGASPIYGSEAIGSEAIGGVVNIITRTAPVSPPPRVEPPVPGRDPGGAGSRSGSGRVLPPLPARARECLRGL